MNTRQYYDRYWDELPLKTEPSDVRRILETYLRPGQDCLDVGCGDGVEGTWLKTLGVDYVGVDVSASAIAKAQTRGLDARLIADAAELPFANEVFDVTLCVEVLEHLVDPATALNEMRRVLRPGGLVFVTVPNVAYFPRRLELALLGRWNPYGDGESLTRPWRDPHLRFFTAGALRRLVQEAGFIDADLSGLGRPAIVERVLHGLDRQTGGWTSRAWYGMERRWPSVVARHLSVLARKPQG